VRCFGTSDDNDKKRKKSFDMVPTVGCLCHPTTCIKNRRRTTFPASDFPFVVDAIAFGLNGNSNGDARQQQRSSQYTSSHYCIILESEAVDVCYAKN